LAGLPEWVSPSEKFSLTVYGENLTGKEYFYSRPAQSTGGWQTPAPPRQVYVTASVKF
jgi:outer membrane receptor protein involved in Fe transport